MSQDSQKVTSRSSSPVDQEQTHLRDKRRRFSVRSLFSVVFTVFLLFGIIRLLFIPHQPLLPLYTNQVIDPNTLFARSHIVPSDFAWFFLIGVILSVVLIFTGPALNKSRFVQLLYYRGRRQWGMVGDIVSTIGWALLVLCVFLFF